MLDILKDIMKILLIFIGGLFLLYLLTSFIELFPKDIQKIVFLAGLNNDRKILKLGYISIPTSRGYGRFGRSGGSRYIGFLYVLCLVAIAVITVASGTYLICGN